jgi:hypothetical protein
MLPSNTVIINIDIIMKNFIPIFVSILVTLSISFTATAQNFPPDDDPVPPSEFVKDVGDLNDELNRMGKSVYESEGSPYLNEEWINGKIYTQSGSKTTQMMMRYNAYDGYLEVQYNNGVLALDPTTIKGFSFTQEGQQHLFMNGYSSSQHDIQKQDFFEVLYNGNMKLLKRHYITRVEATEPDISTGKYVDTYIQKERFYLVKSDDSMEEIKLRRGKVLSMLNNNYRNAIKQYKRDRNLSFRDEQDVAKIVEYLDGM